MSHVLRASVHALSPLFVTSQLLAGCSGGGGSTGGGGAIAGGGVDDAGAAGGGGTTLDAGPTDAGVDAGPPDFSGVTLSFVDARSTSEEAESSASIRVRVETAVPLAGALTIRLGASGGGDAAMGDDYQPLDTATATFAAGSEDGAIAAIPVGLVDDTEVEDDVVLLLESSDAGGASIGSAATHALTIADDDVYRLLGFNEHWVESLEVEGDGVRQVGASGREGLEPNALAFDRATGTLWLADQRRTNRAWAFDIETESLTPRYGFEFTRFPDVFAIESGGTFIVQRRDGSMARLDPATQSATEIVAAGDLEGIDIRSLALNHGTGTLVAVASLEGLERLWTFTLPTSFDTVVTLTGLPSDIAIDEAGNRAFATTGSDLYSIDLTSGAVTSIVGSGPDLRGLAWSGSTLYALEGPVFGRRRIITLDPSTGAIEVVRPLGDRIHDIVYGGADDATRYAIGETGMLYRMEGADPVYVGDTQLEDALIAWDPDADVMYLVASATLYTLDLESAEATMVASLGSVPISDLIVDTSGAAPVLVGLSNTRLVQIDTTSGATTPGADLGEEMSLAYDIANDRALALPSESFMISSLALDTGRVRRSSRPTEFAPRARWRFIRRPET